MYFHHAVFLILSWSSLKGAEGEKQDVIPDQLALASKGDFEKIPHALSKETPSKNSSSDEPFHNAKRVTFNFENSNGFVPIIVPEDQRVRKKLASDTSSKEMEKTKSESVLEIDPVYSMEARIFLNLLQLGANRRSFDSSERRSDFEILKVDNNTPEVANYEEFYDNVQNVMNRSQDPADISEKKSPKNKSRDRNRIVQNNVNAYDINSFQDSGEAYNRHYPVSSSDNNQFKSNYDAEKVNNAAPKEKHISRTNYNMRQLSGGEKKSSSEDAHKSNLMYNTNNRNKNSPANIEYVLSDDKVNIKLGTQSPRSTILSQISEDDSTGSSDSGNFPSHSYVQDNTFDNKGTSRHYERSEESQSFSDESMDYSDITEKPKRLYKSRRRPQNSLGSKKLPKEHRASSQANDDRKRHNSSRTKQRQRQRNKSNSWGEEGRYQFQDGSDEDKQVESSDEEPDNTNFQHVNSQSNAWSQIGANVEVSQSNGYEVDQIEKPKLLVPLNVNLVPISQFDHQTALGNSQGFDVSNAMIQNFGAGMSIISTVAPFVSTSQNPDTKNEKPVQNSRQVPNIILGQNAFQNPVSVFLPQGQKLPNGRTQYIQSTVTPLFTVAQNLNPTTRSTVSNVATTRPLYASASGVNPTYQQVSLNHIPTNQILVPQPTLQTLSNVLQGNANANIQVQPHGIQGQNLVHFQSSPSITTTSNPITQRNSDGSGHYLATASLAVSNGGQKPSSNQQKTIFQTQMVPAILHTGVNLGTLSLNNQNQQNSQNSFIITRPGDGNQIQKATNDAFMSSMKDLQLQIQRNPALNSGYQGVDSSESNSNGNINTVHAVTGLPVGIIKAQLPAVGAKNVEIMNPNIKPSPMDLTIFNPGTPINQYTAMYTTPIPVFSTTSFVTSKPAASVHTPGSVHLSSYMNTPMEQGSKSSTSNIFNPINFQPNEDLIKSQTVLNSRPTQNEVLQQNLNLVSMIPGGNFFKDSKVAQVSLANKPKLNSDFAKYTEEMLKESLRTMHSSQKWNNDRKNPGNISIADSSALAKLRNELLRYKSAVLNSKLPKEILEAHQSENNLRTLNPRPSGSNSKKVSFSMEQIEQILKDDLNLRPVDYLGKPDQEDEKKFRISDHLTPPKPNAFLAKSPFHDKPVKKRPGSGPPGHSRRPNKGSGSGSKPPGPETSASNNFEFSFDVSRFKHRPHFDHDVSDFRPGRHGSFSKFQHKNPGFDHFPAFSSSSLDKGQRKPNKETNGVNHPRFHNLLGLLMKNKRLPNGSPQLPSNNNRERENLPQVLATEKQRLEQQFYNDALQDLAKKFDQPRLTH